MAPLTLREAAREPFQVPAHLRLDLVVEELLAEPGEGVVGAVVVQVQGVEDIPAEGGRQPASRTSFPGPGPPPPPSREENRPLQMPDGSREALMAKCRQPTRGRRPDTPRGTAPPLPLLTHPLPKLFTPGCSTFL